MKKSLLSSLALLFCVLFAISCSKDNAEMDPQEPVELTSYQKAEANVRELLEQIDATTRGGSIRTISTGAEFDLFTKTRSADSVAKLPELFVFNFENNQGFAIATADETLPPVMALTNSGNWNFNQAPEDVDNPGFALFLECMYDYLAEEQKLLDEQQASQTKAVKETIYSEWSTGNTVGNIIPLNWGQHDPYNLYCFTKNGEPALTGCVAVACALIMAHHQYPTYYNGYSYNWAEMTRYTRFYAGDNTQEALMVARLMQQLGLGKKSSDPQHLDMDYGVDGSGASSGHVQRTFKAFGYSNSSGRKDYNIDKIVASINNNKPVYACGYSHKSSFIGITTELWRGHAWVIDAYRPRFRTKTEKENGAIKKVTTEIDYLVDCNWGWNDSYNGFYLSKVFDTNAGPVETRSDVIGYYRYKLEILDGISN